MLRQRKYAPVGSMYLYYWSDPVAMIGSGLLDYYRRPYQVYESMKSVYTPVLISFEWNADPYIIGRDKFFRPATDFTGKVWVTNDWDAVKDALIEWEIVENETGKSVCANSFRSNLDADSNVVIDHIAWPIPAGTSGAHTIKMKVTDATGVLSVNSTEIIVR